MSDKLYSQAKLARVYYSAFSPCPVHPSKTCRRPKRFENFRLYQSSFLLRDYKWDVEELPFLRDGNLRADVDPKQAWADEYLVHSPIEVMQADREQLLRIPGVGPVAAENIIRSRRRGILTELSHLKQIGIRTPHNLPNTFCSMAGSRCASSTCSDRTLGSREAHNS